MVVDRDEQHLPTGAVGRVFVGRVVLFNTFNSQFKPEFIEASGCAS
jgi:hypothetical protein